VWRAIFEFTMEEDPVRARDIMSAGVTSVTADATIFEAARLLVDAAVGSLPVLDENGFLVGIVSEADLLQHGGASPTPLFRRLRRLSDRVDAAAAYVHVNSRHVSDVMTTDVVTASEDDSLQDVASLMLKHRVLRIPVRRGRSVVGMVDRADLLRVMISHRPQSAQSPPSVFASATADEQLRNDVMGAVEGQAWSLAERLDVVMSGGVAHLWGVVPSDVVCRAYRIAAENVPGVSSVVLHMHVVPPLARAAG
jgi:CBS domain-containing protein